MNTVAKNFLRKRRLFPLIGMFGISCVVAGFLVVQRGQKPALSPDELFSCFTSSNGIYTTDAYCLERVVEELMRVYSTGDLLKYIAAAPTPNHVVHKQAIMHFHLIAHFIGKQTFLKTGSIEAALEQCEQDVGYGCLHGVIGAAAVKDLGMSESEAEDLPHADPKTIERIAAKYCASDNIQLCHAVGHILFRALPGYSQALAICEKTDMKDLNRRETCARGVFMESSGPTGSLSPSQNRPFSTETYLQFCDHVSAEYQHACFRYLPKIQMLFFESKKMDSAAQRLAISIPICKERTGHTRADCIEAIGFNAFHVFIDVNHSDRQDFCNQFDAGADRQSCVLGIAGSYVWGFDYNGGVAYCHNITDVKKLQDFCYKALFQTSDQVSMGSAIPVICDKESTQKECNQKLREYLNTKSTLPNYSLGLYGDRR